MTKIFSLLVASTLIATPALADTVTHNGRTFVYAVESTGKKTIITGTGAATGEPFRLVVTKGWVDGNVGGKTVSFSVRDTIRLPRNAEAEQVAAR